MAIADTLDRILGWLKWPAAMAALFLLPGSAMALGRLLAHIAWPPWPILPFVLGFIVYWVVWKLVLWWPIFPSFLSTLEHECTHAMFALATLHRVVGFRATFWKGGQITIQGRGNWLITIAPYFFPTACFLTGLVLMVMPADWRSSMTAVMGLALGYHLKSSRQELHGNQTDLEKVGRLFAWLFLPTANLIALGMVLAFSYGGVGEIGGFLSDIIAQTQVWVGGLVGLIRKR
jgi:hypothetical protein